MSNLEQYSSRSTVRLNGLSESVDEELLFELGTQFGIVKRASINIDKETMAKFDYGFIEFYSPADALYMRDVIQSSIAPLRLFGKQVTVFYNPVNNRDAAEAENLLNVGANIEVSNLDRSMIDLQKLQLHFAQFGRLAGIPKIDLDSGGNNNNTCSATIYFQSHDSAKAAIKAFDGQFLFGRKVRVQYALKEDGSGQRHGSEAEIVLYQQREQQRLAAAASAGASGGVGANINNNSKDDVPPPVDTNWAVGLNPYSSL